MDERDAEARHTGGEDGGSGVDDDGSDWTGVGSTDRRQDLSLIHI